MRSFSNGAPGGKRFSLSFFIVAKQPTATVAFPPWQRRRVRNLVPLVLFFFSFISTSSEMETGLPFARRGKSMKLNHLYLNFFFSFFFGVFFPLFVTEECGVDAPPSSSGSGFKKHTATDLLVSPVPPFPPTFQREKNRIVSFAADIGGCFSFFFRFPF